MIAFNHPLLLIAVPRLPAPQLQLGESVLRKRTGTPGYPVCVFFSQIIRGSEEEVTHHDHWKKRELVLEER